MALVLKLLGGKTSQAEVTMELEWDLRSSGNACSQGPRPYPNYRVIGLRIVA